MKALKVILAAAVIFILLATAACRRDSASGGDNLIDAMGAPIDPSKVNRDLKGEISWWVWGDYEIRGMQDFNKYFPNIKINFVAVPSDEFPERVLMAFATGIDLPDIINIESSERGQFNNMDVWERLDAPPYNMNRNDILPVGIPLISNSRDEIVCMQIDNCVAGFIYDRNLMRKYFGTDDPNEVERLFATVDDFLNKSSVVSAGGDYMFASAGDLWEAMGSLYREPHTNGARLNTDRTMLPFFHVLERLVANQAIGPYVQWSPSWFTSFSANNVLFNQGPAWFVSYVIRPADPESTGKYGMMMAPGGGFNRGGTAYAIPKRARNKELAWEAIRWFTLSMEGSKSFFQAHDATTMYRPAYDAGLFQGRNDPYFGGQNWVDKLNQISMHPGTTAPVMGPFDFQIRRANEQVMNDMINGRMNAAQGYARFLSLLAERAPELTR